jgi:transposase
MDMSVAFRGAVSTNLPKAKIVFDHFHVIKLFNDKLSELRRALYREATDMMQKKVLKGTRWLLLKNPENLDTDKDEKRRLKEALKLNEPLATAYYDVMISSGPMEGTNNKIKTMKRQAYGFRDMEFFKLKILAIHESKFALVG